MDPTLILLPLLAVMVFFMWRSNRKRQEQVREMQSSAIVGAEVMTNTGLFGTIVERDEDENIVTLESTPGTRLRVHSTTIARVLTPSVPDDASALAEAEADEPGAVDERDAAEQPDETERREPLAEQGPVDKQGDHEAEGDAEPGTGQAGGDAPLGGGR